MPGTATQERFRLALDALVEQLKKDRSILAAILCGSLSYDTVWEKSDIDLGLITVDDTKRGVSHIALSAGTIPVHAFLMPRTEFRKTAEGVTRNSFFHSLLAKGRLVYTHDPTIETLVEQLRGLGERDTRIQLLRIAMSALLPLDKARKWLVVRGDLEYAAFWILEVANILARLEVTSASLLADREVLPQALKLNPKFFGLIYSNLLNSKKTPSAVGAALDAIDAYLADKTKTIFSPVIDYLRDAGEARSSTEIDAYFQKHFELESVLPACEYLASQGRIVLAATAVQLTRRSNVSLQEMAFAFAGNTREEDYQAY